MEGPLDSYAKKPFLGPTADLAEQTAPKDIHPLRVNGGSLLYILLASIDVVLCAVSAVVAASVSGVVVRVVAALAPRSRSWAGLRAPSSGGSGVGVHVQVPASIVASMTCEKQPLLSPSLSVISQLVSTRRRGNCAKVSAHACSNPA